MLRGPVDKVEPTLATLQQAGILADRSVRGPDVLEAFFYGGDERPSPPFMDACTSKVATAVIGTDFVVEETGTMAGGAATRQLAYDRRTGEWLGSFIDTATPEPDRVAALARLAEDKGIGVADIELRDPPEFHPTAG